MPCLAPYHLASLSSKNFQTRVQKIPYPQHKAPYASCGSVHSAHVVCFMLVWFSIASFANNQTSVMKCCLYSKLSVRLIVLTRNSSCSEVSLARRASNNALKIFSFQKAVFETKRSTTCLTLVKFRASSATRASNSRFCRFASAFVPPKTSPSLPYVSSKHFPRTAVTSILKNYQQLKKVFGQK